jgi:2-amino-4-hydroxy-6-hydroxymethyldihydropteridine diphosphokinase
VGVKPEYRRLKYLNAVVILEADLDARAWLRRSGGIEAELGRVRTDDRFAPRTMDIDLLYRGDDRFDDGGLTVPHPRWMQRLFVVRPLADVRPDLRMPGDPLRVLDHLAPLETASEKVIEWVRTW